MATRYYLSNTAVAPASPAFDANWNSTLWADDHFGMSTTKSNSALGGNTSTACGTGTTCAFVGTPTQMVMRQYVGPQIGVINFNLTTVSAVIKCGVSATAGVTVKLALGVRLLHTDGTLTVLLSPTAADYDTTFPATASAATRIANAVTLANVSSSNGDRLIVEVGADWSVAVASCRTLTVTDGDPTATSDYALSSGLTTGDPWVEFSATVPAMSVIPDLIQQPLLPKGR
jgi:hypothetical protein